MVMLDIVKRLNNWIVELESLKIEMLPTYVILSSPIRVKNQSIGELLLFRNLGSFVWLGGV
jgi:hypothetical protein